MVNLQRVSVGVRLVVLAGWLTCTFLTLAVLLIACVIVSSPVRAAGPPNAFQYWNNSFQSTHYSSANSACQGIAAYNGRPAVCSDCTPLQFSGCHCTYTDNGASGGGVFFNGYECGANQTKSGTAPNEICTCNAGTGWNGSACTTDPGNCATKIGNPAWSSCTGTKCFGPGITDFCDGPNPAGGAGCVAAATDSLCTLSGCQKQGKITAANCTMPTPSSPPLPMQCPSGQCYGTVNGTGICVACESSERKNPAASVTTAPANQTTSPTAPAGTASQSSTQSTSTSCTGSNCTTTTTTTTQFKDASGANLGPPQVTAETKVDPTKSKTDQQDYCDTHPRSPMCIEGNWSDSACAGAAPACSGDAVQCAQALQEYKTACALTKTSSSSDLGLALVAGTDPLSSSLPSTTTGTTVSVSAALNQSSFLGGSCLANESFTVKGQTVTIPWSSLCDSMAAAGVALMAIAFLVALRNVGVTA